MIANKCVATFSPTSCDVTTHVTGKKMEPNANIRAGRRPSWKALVLQLMEAMEAGGGKKRGKASFKAQRELEDMAEKRAEGAI